MKNVFKVSLLAVVLSGAIFSCSKQELNDVKKSATLEQDGKVVSLNAPTITCGSSTGASITLSVCAGASGTPAGFSVQWMLKSEFDATGWPVSSEVGSGSFCKASFSGVPGGSNYNLGPNACINVTIGDVIYDELGASSPCESIPLKCGQAYVFRAFAHNDPRSGAGKSAFSANQSCSTLACSTSDDGCTYTQGYWKTHGPAPTGNNSYVWPLIVKEGGLTLGTVNYTAEQLLSIFNNPGSSNGLVKLAHQLIAAKLNIANGADATAIESTITAADGVIGSLVIPPVGTATDKSAYISSLNDGLAAYNEGKTGPGHCGE